MDKSFKHGQGYKKYKDNTYFMGKYEKDLKVEGVIKDLNNGALIYEGGWKKDTYHNHGNLTRRNGDKYSGDFFFGDCHGKGKLEWNNGDVYEGDFYKNLREGKGRMTLKNGDFYEGDFSQNKFHGKGRYEWKDSGDVFYGNFEKGKMCEGKMEYKIGIEGEGDFRTTYRDTGVSYSVI